MKKDRHKTQEKFLNWWNGKGFIVGSAVPLYRINSETPDTKKPKAEEMYLEPEKGIAWMEQDIYRQEFPLDTLHSANINIGPGYIFRIRT